MSVVNFMDIHNSVYGRLFSMLVFGGFLMALAVFFSGLLFADNVILATIFFDVAAAGCALVVCCEQEVPAVPVAACFSGRVVPVVAISSVLLLCTWFTTQVTSTVLMTSGVSVGGYADLPTETWPYFILTLLAAPVCEECLCRRYLFDNLRAFPGMPVWFALVLQALIFGVMHGTPVHVYCGLSAGMFFGLVYLETGRLWVGMILHSLYNLFCLLPDLELPVVFFSWPSVIGLNIGLAVSFAAFYKFVIKSCTISCSGPL